MSCCICFQRQVAQSPQARCLKPQRCVFSWSEVFSSLSPWVTKTSLETCFIASWRFLGFQESLLTAVMPRRDFNHAQTSVNSLAPWPSTCALQIITAKFWSGCVCCVSCVWLFATPWAAALQASLSITMSQSLLQFTSIESVMLFNHLFLCHPLLLSSIFPSIMVFSNELALRIEWPKYWSFSISPSSGYLGLISFRIDWFDLLVVQVLVVGGSQCF